MKVKDGKTPFSDMATCNLCGERVKVSGLTRHLASCRTAHPAKPGKQELTIYTLKVQGAWMPDYFLYLELGDFLTFDVLDAFLREIWLECCGHLSHFIINEKYYSDTSGNDFKLSRLGFPEDTDYRIGIGTVLTKGLTFDYEYDFGSTTELQLKVVGERRGCEQPRRAPFLLARNDPPAWVCADCGAPAVKVDSMGYGISVENVCCAKCAAKRKKKSECYFFNIANSPRTGVCAYQ
jgi:hypothetical protein